MKHEVLDLQFTDLASRGSRFLKRGAVPFARSNPVLTAALLFSLLSAIYWFFIASDRYVSETHIIVQKTELSGGPSIDLTSFLTGSSSNNRADQLVLRDYLRSKDIVRKIDQALDLRGHYSSWKIDPLSKLKNSPTIEELHQYYLSRVSVNYDDYSGVLIVKAEGFDPGTAQKISKLLVREGENFMNAMAHSLARDQVVFLEKEVAILGRRAADARQAVLDYQNRNGLVSPEATAQSITGIVGQLEAQKTELQTRLTAMQAYLVADHPSLVQVQQQIDALNEQIDQENARLAAPQGNKLNSKAEQFQRLEMEAGFAQDLYKTALIALEKGRVEGTRTIKKMSIVQQPSLPEYPEQPRRLYEAVLYAIMAMLVAGVAHLLMAIVRDHRD